MNISLINLTEGNFPFNIKQELKLLDGLGNLGSSKGPIKINLEFKKLDKNTFLVQGDISLTIINECQRCSKPMDTILNIDMEVCIKDKIELNSNLEETSEIHYQSLEFFNLENLILEEIYLNFPTVSLCCSAEEHENFLNNRDEKIRPFKKIRDLIK